MSILVSTKYRSDEQEIMDDLDYKGPILHDALDKLASINQWLGGNIVTRNGLKYVLKSHDKSIPVTIVDLGCGGGDILREISRYGIQNGYNFNLIGIDANKHTIAYAKESSNQYDNIQFKTMDIFSEEFNTLEYDVVLATLFLHHFKESELLSFIKPVLEKAKLGIVVNDLHRHKLAYYLFKLLSLTIRNQTIVQDGLTSVLRGFKRSELESISKQLNASYRIKWKWAFRFQWILKSIKE
ncbi:methyltransferase domain-containing protein [Psychroserpens sp.]|uniref:methyltransferase domain-containing protein n=1 Tax=Psychroserpens sp. TaxID=2020870 RepID=UPI001B23CD3F|nr:methyltransferase domain-containing protein [Psychroserpens sp.]MBO6605293.1 methyltransferase domain-containing protein [Psychroserpens sp.]MBO6631723.1 methyltransferase domain-containing protein [Psychroserpens sp.]MBO6653898.1 methyltransferase domain-containing protein [Psychroserpens sp.]MBO6682219.1 methyltransferase domain-containing protein [Psychroserpens sp.]MBO6748667.1 methyltransferase domain-containing protein [Psychroserpens sp.]